MAVLIWCKIPDEKKVPSTISVNSKKSTSTQNNMLKIIHDKPNKGNFSVNLLIFNE